MTILSSFFRLSETVRKEMDGKKELLIVLVTNIYYRIYNKILINVGFFQAIDNYVGGDGSQKGGVNNVRMETYKMEERFLNLYTFLNEIENTVL